MGNNATVVVLLDQLHVIERDPEFGKKLAAAIRYRASMPAEIDQPGASGYKYAGNEATGQTQVIEVHHADNMMVVAIGGNTGQVLGVGGYYSDTPEGIVKALVKSRKFQKQMEKTEKP